MLIKDRHCLESILDAIQRIKEYSGEFNSADAFMTITGVLMLL